MKLLDICIPIRGDSDRVGVTLEHLIQEEILEVAHLCISENQLDSGFGSAAQELGIPPEAFTLSRSTDELSFPENLARSGHLGSSPFLTFCGAGDLVRSSVIDLVLLMEKHPQTCIATGEFDLYTDRRREMLSAAKPRQLQSDRGDEYMEDVANQTHWLFASSLASIGGWVMRRPYFELALLQTSPMWEESRFPMRIWALPSLQDGRVINYTQKIYSSRLELDSSRQTNSMYEDTRWCTEVSQAAADIVPLIADDIHNIETNQIDGNILSFLSFGSKPVAQRAISLLDDRSRRLFWTLVIQVLGSRPMRLLTQKLILQYRLVQPNRLRRQRGR